MELRSRLWCSPFWPSIRRSVVELRSRLWYFPSWPSIRRPMAGRLAGAVTLAWSSSRSLIGSLKAERCAAELREQALGRIRWTGRRLPRWSRTQRSDASARRLQAPVVRTMPKPAAAAAARFGSLAIYPCSGSTVWSWRDYRWLSGESSRWELPRTCRCKQGL